MLFYATTGRVIRYLTLVEVTDEFIVADSSEGTRMRFDKKSGFQHNGPFHIPRKSLPIILNS
jgi:hypothetical protein